MRASAYASLGDGWFSDVAFNATSNRGYLIGGFVGVGIRILTWIGQDISGSAGPRLTEIFREALIEGIGYSRCCIWGGVAWAAWHDGRVGHLANLTTGQRRILQPCENNNPICFGFGYVAWQGAANASWPVSRMVLATGEIVPNVRMGVGTGLSRVLADGSVVTVDEDRFALPGATQPCFSGELAVGEDAVNGTRWRLAGNVTGRLWPGEDTFTPKCALDGAIVAVTTGGGRGGIRLFCGTRDELLTLKDGPVSEIPGCHDGLLTDPEAYFRSLVVGTVATDYQSVLPRIQPDLNKYNIDIQHDSAGTLRPRLFLPNPVGNARRFFRKDVAPDTPLHEPLAADFDRAVDVTDNPPQTSPDGGWRWIDRNPGAGYTPAPCSGATTATLVSLAAMPPSVQGGGTVQAIVTLSSPAPAGGAPVGLSSSSSAVAQLPSAVTVLEGSSSASVAVRTSTVTTATTATLFASYAGVIKSAPLTVTAAPTSDLEARVAALESQVASLTAQMATTAKKGDPVTVTLTGKVVS